MKNSFPILFVLIFSLIGCQSSELDDPSTVIPIDIGEESFVVLRVLNSYDVVVATLINDYKPAGYYNVQFSVENLAEGIYFYVLETTGKSTGIYNKYVRQIILVK